MDTSRPCVIRGDSEKIKLVTTTMPKVRRAGDLGLP
jgi:hypothetical protein